ncbi:MAG: phenylalanine--tRNA ligase subunit beta [Gemmatimonadaceae bacterium]
MIVSHEWLKQFVPHDLSPEEVGDMISRHTVTLDGIESAGADLSAFVVGRVVFREKHPNSDKLSVTKVDDGSGELLDVVCGAQNIVVGAKYPFARTGTTMPAGITIEKRKIRGETSNGMLCSARELGLGEDHDGILQLDTDAEPGTPLLQVLSAGDSRLNLDVLPNRPDLLSHRGVARELSAISGKPFVVLPLEGLVANRSQPHGVIEGAANPHASVSGSASATSGGVTVRIEDAASCSQYLAVVVRGVKVGDSPAWLKQRLESIGVRSISNVVDFTNYVLHGYGQPIHAFDLGKLAGSSIVVRPTRAGETMVTLDGTERKLEPGTTVICDGERPVALAGVMGGKDSEVTETTTDLLIEIASFDARFVRKVRRSVNLSTDASYRFERGTDEHALEEIAALTLFMLPKIAGGAVESIIFVGAERAAAKPVAVRVSRVSHLVGVHVSVVDSKRYLESIGCSVQVNFSTENGANEVSADDATKIMFVTSPTWRNDLNLEVDFIEEIARLKGFDVLPDELRATRPGNVPDHPLYSVGRRVRDALVTAGLAETRPMPFTKTGDESLRVRNPLADDEPFLRQSILETLARRAEFNLARMQGNIRLFEVGNAFVASTSRLPREETRVGALIMGMRRPPHFTEPNPPAFDVWDAKALAETMIGAAFPRGVATLEAGEGDTLWVIKSRKGNVLGRVARVALDKPVWASDAYGVELLLGAMSSIDVAAARGNAHGLFVPSTPDALQDAKAASVVTSAHATYQPIPTTPAAEFDLALLVPDATMAMDVERVLRATAGDLLESVHLFDEFRGSGVPEGSRSLAFHLTFRHPERTLKEKEIEGRRLALLDQLNKELGIKPRAS